MTHASVCSKDCLLEGLDTTKLPPPELYNDPEEFLNPHKGDSLRSAVGSSSVSGDLSRSARA